MNKIDKIKIDKINLKRISDYNSLSSIETTLLDISNPIHKGLLDKKESIIELASSKRNENIFDNNNILGYYLINPNNRSQIWGKRRVPGFENLPSVVNDHLIGMKSAVCFIFIKYLYRKWHDTNNTKDYEVYDNTFHNNFYINCIKAFQASIPIPKYLNNQRDYKKSFDYDNIDNCLNWNTKLKNAGFKECVDKNGNIYTIDDIYNMWLIEYYPYLH